LVNGDRFDVAVCDFLAASLNFPRSSGTPTLLFQHNVESALWERQARHEANLLRRLAYKIEAAKMARYEATAVRAFDHIIAVSRHDRDLMSAMTDPSRISVVPTGVDLEQYRKATETSGQRSEVRGQTGNDSGHEARPLVVFTGSMDWDANIDGAEYFCREVWPLVLSAAPASRFRIVGRDPDLRVTRLASDSVEVTGTVPSIIEHLREAAAVVVPLRIGGGTRLKIYEAMAMGKAVVSTTIGAEGLDVNHGEDILLEDSPEAFARSLIRLLRDPDQRQQIETAAARQASKFDWPVVTRQFEEVLVRVAGQQSSVGLPDTIKPASRLGARGPAPAGPTAK
jgi:glycosyltransferase involved in cell wall biosynthesis